MSLIPLPRSKSQIFTGDTWQGRGGSSEVGSRAWGSCRPVLGSSAPPHPSPGWGARRGCSPASGPCGRCLQGERRPVGGERGWAPRGPGALGRLAGGGWHPAQPAPPPTFVVQEIQGAGHVLHHHARLQLVEVPALVDVAQDGAWPREDTGDGRVTVRLGHSAAPAPPGTEAPAQPPRAKVFNLSCCVARKLRLHEPSLPRMTL